MSSVSLRVANAAVRAWTKLYTWRLPPSLRDARREEVECDLWESEHDPDGAQPALQIFARLLIGGADDLGWRFEQENTMARYLNLRSATAIALACLVLIWIVIETTFSPRASQPHVLPPKLHAGLFGPYPATPPPPTPPPSLPGDRPVQSLPWLYGETSYDVPRGTTRPVNVKDVRPIYPPIAVSYGLKGTVILEATIDERGRVVDARTVRSIPVLEEAAINAVRQWEFQPPIVDGVPKQVVITVTARFGS